jgi:hypothetical protein
MRLLFALMLLAQPAPPTPPPEVPTLGSFWAPGVPDGGMYLSIVADGSRQFVVRLPDGVPIDVDSISRGTYCAIEPPELLCESGSPPGVTWAPQVPAWVLLRFEATPASVTVTQSGQEVVWKPYTAPPPMLVVPRLALPLIWR